MHRRKIVVAGFVAMHDAQRDAGARDLRPFLADVLAMLVVHRREEVVEIGPAAAIAPVVLHVDARQPVGVEGRIASSARWKLTCADDQPACAHDRDDRRGQQRARASSSRASRRGPVTGV